MIHIYNCFVSRRLQIVISILYLTFSIKQYFKEYCHPFILQSFQPYFLKVISDSPIESYSNSFCRQNNTFLKEVSKHDSICLLNTNYRPQTSCNVHHSNALKPKGEATILLINKTYSVTCFQNNPAM